MIQTSKYIFSLLLITGCAFRLHAQSVILPSAIRLGTDAARLGKSVLDPHRTQFELNSDIDVYKYFLTFDYGHWNSSLSGEDYDYEMSGNYFRAGIEYNFLFADPDNQAIFFGIKYGRTKFNDSFGYSSSDPYYGSSSSLLTKTGNRGSWFEMNAGLKVHIWEGLYMGWTGRMKFGLSLDAPGGYTSYEIPGYGEAASDTNWSISYNIYYRFQFRKKPLILPKSKKTSEEE